MGYKKLSQEQELQLVKEYQEGVPVKELMAKYGYKNKKSITDKVKKHFPENYQNIVKDARDNRRGYAYSLAELASPFDAYLVGLLLTDGYVLSDRDGLGLEMADEDVIKFVADTIGTTYASYAHEGRKTLHRVLITIPGISTEAARFGIIPRKSNIVPEPQLNEKERRLLPFIIRGIIDGDGCVSKTSYGGAQFYIVTKSEVFANWIKKVLENNFFMDDITIRKNKEGLYRIETANQYNILKLIALVYNRPFGMNRKYKDLRKTFRDYNGDALLDKDEGIVQTTTV